MNTADKKIIKQAGLILEAYFKVENSVLIKNPSDVIEFLKLNLSLEEREVFAIMFLDNQHRLISFEKMFFGTVNNCSIHPREIVKEALKLNSSAVILSHNHPSGDCDSKVTTHIKDALEMFGIRVLDHIIVGRLNSFSFSEHNIL